LFPLLLIQNGQTKINDLVIDLKPPKHINIQKVVNEFKATSDSTGIRYLSAFIIQSKASRILANIDSLDRIINNLVEGVPTDKLPWPDNNE
jgi:hypothetical protein